MTLDELRLKEDRIRVMVDAWTDEDRRIAYAYLHRGYDMRITDCERALARALLGEDGGRDRMR